MKLLLKAAVSTKPDFVKVVLVYSEVFEQRKTDPKYFSRRGLDPRLLPLIVQTAKAFGLPVVAHVESAADFHVAVAAGVNQIAHTPGFWPMDDAIAEKSFERYRISEADARLARQETHPGNHHSGRVVRVAARPKDEGCREPAA